MAGLPIQLSMPLLIALAFSVSLGQANPIVTNETIPTEETWTNAVNSFFNKTKTFSSTKTTNSSDPIVSTTEKFDIESSLANNKTLNNFVMQTQQTRNSDVNNTLEFVTLSADTVNINKSKFSEILDWLDIAKRIFLALAVTFVVTLLVPFLFLILLCCLGFTCSGVRGSSYAAIRQSDIGNVSSGSGFSHMQSVASGGCMEVLFGISLAIGITAGIISFIYSWPAF